METSVVKLNGDSSTVASQNDLDIFPPDTSNSDLMYISPEVTKMITLVNVVIISGVLSLFGMATNVVNIIVFTRQGFQESVNISLCALAFSDFLSLLTLFWISICYNPLFTDADISFLSMEVEIVTGGIPHVIAINATGWLTAFVTFERCICIAFPLKVKDIITPRRTKVLVATIFILVVACQIPIFYASQLGWKFVPDRNRTVLGIVFHEDSQAIMGVTFYVANVLGPLATFTCVTVCTTVLIVKLLQKSQWRQQQTKVTVTAKAKAGEGEDSSATKASASTIRDRKVVKMVVTVAVIFIASFTPTVIIFIMMIRYPGFKIAGGYERNFMVALDFALLIEAMNGSVNIFIYYNMSSKYKLIFRAIFFGEKMVA